MSEVEVELINYDRFVKNLIHRLDETGHVTHSKWAKKSVTLHHNGAKLSHEGVLKTWKTRPASAHFDVDKEGEIAQYVIVNEYAWAVGNTKGNEETISIEMANISLAPHYEVAQVTLDSTARLSGWLFANEVEGQPHPSEHNFFPHQHWFATACPGPFVMAHFHEILRDTQRHYEFFMERKQHRHHP